MSTRVSWIDPSQLKDLVGQLRDPAAEADTSAWEVHTLPSEMGLGARELGIPDDDLWLPVEPAPPLPEPEQEEGPFFLPQPPIVETLPIYVPSEREGPEPLPEEPVPEAFCDPAPEEDFEIEPAAIVTPSGPPVELNRIREKLQAIRERAIEAGLLAHRPTEAPKVVEVLEIDPPPVSEAIPAPEEILPAATPDPVGDTGPIEVDQFEVSSPERPFAIQSPFGIADSFEGGDSPPVIEEEPWLEFTPPDGPIMERLAAFGQWAMEWLGTQEFLIADDHGDVLWGEQAQSGLMVTTMMAGKAAHRSTALGASDPLGVTETPVSIGRLLTSVPCQTRFGTLNIGLIRSSSVSAEEAANLKKNLVRALDVG